ncbi:MAG TPA: hypothetical protein VFM93_13355 [Candidatus Limnocylindria bacterium]|nr:hypothetical protein [Candidatus Limnocylindria bacterium]
MRALAPYAAVLGSAPLTIRAQTLRMRVIPDALRGRSFALLRTLMQGALPLGAAAAAGVLALGGLGGAVAATAALLGLPGLAALVREDVRSAGRPSAGRG